MNTPAPNTALTQDELKTLVGQAALQSVVRGEIVWGRDGLYREQIYRCFGDDERRDQRRGI